MADKFQDERKPERARHVRANPSSLTVPRLHTPLAMDMDYYTEQSFLSEILSSLYVPVSPCDSQLFFFPLVPRAKRARAETRR